MTLEDFSSARLSVGQDPWIEPSTATATAEGSYKTASFYQDSSGKSTLDLPLRIAFASAESLQALLAAKCLYPPPKIIRTPEASLPSLDPACITNNDTSQEPTKEQASEPGSAPDDSHTNSTDDDDRFSFGVEAKVTMTSGSGEAVSATVESVNLLSSAVDPDSVMLLLETQLVLRVSRQENDGMVGDSNSNNSKNNASLNDVRLSLEISAVLSEKSQVEDRETAASVGLRALYLGKYADLGKSSARRVVHTRLEPIGLHVNLTNAFLVSARSMSGPNIGETLVSLTIRHSNTHATDVVVSNLALHPAFSRSARSGGPSDQSGAVQWGFAPGVHFPMPMSIRPHHAHSTILHILGSSETGQAFVSPLSVTASVKPPSSEAAKSKSVVQAVQVEWESASQVPSNSSDALRVDISVEDECKVGEPFAVKLRVQNLGQDSAGTNLKLLLPESHLTATNDFRILGIGGVSVEESPGGATDLLQVDEALPLAEIRSREAVEAQVRFIALQKGTIRIPPFEIRDPDRNRSFRCVHNVQVVVS
jgi:hypothetical protein